MVAEAEQSNIKLGWKDKKIQLGLESCYSYVLDLYIVNESIIFDRLIRFYVQVLGQD